MKKILLFACLLALCNSTLFGQTSLKVVHPPQRPAIHVPPQEAPAGLKIIYNNLGKGNDVYNDYWAWQVSGPNSGFQEFIAMPFTPKTAAHVTEVQVAVEYYSGANQVNLSIYSDASGAPGTLLAGPVTVTNLPVAGTCCTLAIADFTALAVAGGTQYWVVADTPASGTGSDFLGQWGWVTKKSVPFAQDSDSQGWYTLPSDGLPAGKVLGTVP